MAIYMNQVFSVLLSRTTLLAMLEVAFESFVCKSSYRISCILPEKTCIKSWIDISSN